MECEKAFCDVMLNFMFPDFIVVEAIPGTLIHCEYYTWYNIHMRWQEGAIESFSGNHPEFNFEI